MAGRSRGAPRGRGGRRGGRGRGGRRPTQRSLRDSLEEAIPPDPAPGDGSVPSVDDGAPPGAQQSMSPGSTPSTGAPTGGGPAEAAPPTSGTSARIVSPAPAPGPSSPIPGPEAPSGSGASSPVGMAGSSLPPPLRNRQPRVVRSSSPGAGLADIPRPDYDAVLDPLARRQLAEAYVEKTLAKRTLEKHSHAPKLFMVRVGIYEIGPWWM